MKLMRLIVLFDLPTKSKEEKKAHARFRKFLTGDGYTMLQYSVYSRETSGRDGIEKHERRLKHNLPPSGNVRLMVMTEKQFSQMKFLVGEPSAQEKEVGSQLELFI